MPKANKYEGRIPSFYRRQIMDILLFAHVTAMHERNNMTLEDAIMDFLDLYDVSELEYPIESALTKYNRVRNNFIWTNIKDKLDSECK